MRIELLRVSPRFFHAFMMFGLFYGCGMPRPTDSSVAGTVSGQAMSESAVRSAIVNAGFESAVVDRMVCTAWYESNWHTGSRNTNANGSTDIGLLQINSVNWRWCGVTRTSLLDPSINAECGHKIYRSQGMGAWYGYRKHRTTCDNYTGGRLHFRGGEIAVAADADAAQREEFGDGTPLGDPTYVDTADMNNGLDISN